MTRDMTSAVRIRRSRTTSLVASAPDTRSETAGCGRGRDGLAGGVLLLEPVPLPPSAMATCAGVLCAVLGRFPFPTSGSRTAPATPSPCSARPAAWCPGSSRRPRRGTGPDRCSTGSGSGGAAMLAGAVADTAVNDIHGLPTLTGAAIGAGLLLRRRGRAREAEPRPSPTAAGTRYGASIPLAPKIRPAGMPRAAMAGTVTRACRPGDRTSSGTGPAAGQDPPPLARRRAGVAAQRREHPGEDEPGRGHRPGDQEHRPVAAGTREPRASDRQPPAASRQPPPASLVPPPARTASGTRERRSATRPRRAGAPGPVSVPRAVHRSPRTTPVRSPAVPRPFRRTVNRWNRRATGPPVRPAGPSRPSGTARRGLSRAVVGGRDRPRGPAARELLHGRRGDGREEVDEVAVGVAQQQ